MSKTILEQALDHLLNKEEGKASELLHNYYVGIGRKVYEDIMADDHAFEEEDEDYAQHAVGAVDEVESDLTEEGEESEEYSSEMDEENPEGEEAEMALGDEMGAEEATDVDAADVADAMMDVESALAKLKAEFEEMVSGEHAEPDADNMGGPSDHDADNEEMPMTGEALEEALELQRVKLDANSEGQAAGAGTGYANGVTGTTNTTSPVAKRNPMMARPATNFAGGTAQGVPSGTSPAKAPASKDLGMTTRPNFNKVSKPGTAPGREAGSSPSDLPRG